jgi:hypothetical protein
LIDITFVNKIPFPVTCSRHIKFGTIKALANRQLPTVQDKLSAVLWLYTHRGFAIGPIFADPEFEPLREFFQTLKPCGADNHIPDVERFIQTIKDRARSTYRKKLSGKTVPVS